MNTTVDVIVLGTGSAAQSVAYPCREAGWSVAVVDYHPFGGTCQLRGCDPKKVLVGEQVPLQPLTKEKQERKRKEEIHAAPIT